MSVLAVYDCMLFFMEAARPDRARETFKLLRARTVSVFVSTEVLAELQGVLDRPEYRLKFPALTDEAVKAFLSEVAALTVLVPIVPPVYTLERDPKDSKYINLALAAGAEYLVTRDNDLLDLMDQTSAEAANFASAFPSSTSSSHENSCEWPEILPGDDHSAVLARLNTL